MGKGDKNIDGNKYSMDKNYAAEVIAKNVKHPAQNNPSEGARK